jgi:hypothetical protein
MLRNLAGLVLWILAVGSSFAAFYLNIVAAKRRVSVRPTGSFVRPEMEWGSGCIPNGIMF